MIIFSPGPSNISERVRGALLAPDVCHRDEEFTTLLARVRSRILDVAGVGDRYASVVYTGSGSVGIESTVASARAVGKLLVVSNGPYGERAAAMAQYHGVKTDEWRLGWGEEIDPERLEERILRAAASAVYVVHHETATGRLNDLESLARAAKRHNCLVFVDAVSSIAGEELDVEAWGLDVVIGSANKCIRGVPGAAFVVATREYLDYASRTRYAHYSSMGEHFAAEERGETPYTPALQTFFAFDEALAETLDETVAGRRAHYTSLMARVHDHLDRLGIERLLPRAAYGHTLVSCTLPSGWTFAALHRELKKDGWVIYAAQGKLKESAFRLGIIGHFGAAEVDGLFASMAAVLQREAVAP